MHFKHASAVGACRPARKKTRQNHSFAQRCEIETAASVLVLIASGLLTVAHAETPLPNTLPVPVAGAGFVTSGMAGILPPNAPNVPQTPNTLNVQQTTPRAILNWQSFDIASDSTVNFLQPDASSIALNRIGGSTPSVIQGKLNANGQIYLINQNGIVFDKGSQVNVGGLIASTLDISDERFNNGILASGQNADPAFEGEDDTGLVKVEKGAKLKTTNGGRIALFAPTVENHGLIETPDGQTLLAAGQKIYLTASADPSVRGLLVEVDSGGTATNLGQIIAERGNATLVGLAVNQSGRISATTTVNANGSILLQARDTTETDSVGGRTVRRATRGGTLTLGEGSITEILPELADTATSTDQQTFSPSKVELSGKAIELQKKAVVRAPGGEVNLVARELTSRSGAGAQDGSRIYLDKGSRIDVAGTKDVPIPVERNFIEVELRGNELRDAPLQRNGFLRGKKVTVDVRQVGPNGRTPIADLSGFIAQTGRGVGERTSEGGTISLQSDGDIIVREGATLDVSAGSLNFLEGFASPTQLITDDGRVFDFALAPADLTYTGFANVFIVEHEKYGVTETFVSQAARRFIPGYTEGRDAGTIELLSREIALQGTLLGNTASGRLQREAPPAGGQLLIGSGLVAEPVDFRAPGVRFERTVTGLLEDAFNLASELEEAPLVLSTEFLRSGGFSRVEIFSNGEIIVPEGVDLIAPAGGEISLVGRRIDVAGNIDVPSGSITLSSRVIADTAVDVSGAENPGSEVRVAPGVQITARGLWVNDSPLTTTLEGTGPLLIDGGSVSISSDEVPGAGSADIILGAGSLIDVSGGARVDRDNELVAGAGGSISIETAGRGSRDPGRDSVRLVLDGELRAYGLVEGGSLEITASAVRIGGSGAGEEGELLLTPEFFTQGGFSEFDITGRSGVHIAADTVIEPLTRNLVLNDDFLLRPSAPDILGFTSVDLLPQDLRAPASISLTAGNLFFGNVLVDEGAVIRTDPQAAISLAAARQLTVLGTLNAPAGQIDLSILSRRPPGDPEDERGFIPGQSIWLGAESRLLSRGVVELESDLSGRNLRQGSVLAGGDIRIDAQRGYIVTEAGSRIDVSGISAELDLPQLNEGRPGFVPTLVAGEAGSITLTAREGALLDGVLLAQAGAGGQATGGLLSLRVFRQEDFTGTLDDELMAQGFLLGNREIVVRERGSSVPGDLKPGEAIDVANNGKVFITQDTITDGGFDRLSLASRDLIGFDGDVTLNLRHSINLDARALVGTDSSQTRLSAAYVSLGNTVRNAQVPIPESSPESSLGEARLRIDAGLIDLRGNSVLQGFAQADFVSTGDIRLRGVLTDDVAARELLGSLSSAGALSFSADQLYPATLSQFTINSAIAVSFLPGEASVAPLSAGGRLTVNAPLIRQAGTLRAPLGQISLNATGGTLTLESGSVTSVSAQGLLIPFGQVQGGEQLIYELEQGRFTVIDRPPQKAIALTGDSVDIQSGATVNLAGGGELIAYEFLPGPGGSRDVLADPNTFAVVPGLSLDFAPFDQQSSLDSNLQPGDSVFLTGVDGLPDGFYTLLPARYALLPGAFTVRAAPGFQDLLPGQTFAQPDGSTIVSGYRTVAGTDIRDSRNSGFLVTPGAIVRTQAEYRVSEASTFFRDAARRAESTLPRLPADAGRLALAATQDLRLNGTTLFDAAEGGRGGQADIAAPRIAVVSTSGAPAGFLSLDAGALTRLGVESLLLGGTRSETAAGTQITVGASEVLIANDTTSPLQAPEIILAASDQITLAEGSVIEASGTAVQAPTTITIGVADDETVPGEQGIAGNGALLRASTGAQTRVVRINTSLDNPGTLTVGSNASVTAATGSLLFDATRDTIIDGSATLDSQAISLSASRISLGNTAGVDEGLILSDDLLAQLQSATELALRSYSTLDIYGAVTLGELDASGQPQLVDLTIDSAGIAGYGDGDKRFNAGRITLINTTGAEFSGTPDGTGKLILSAPEVRQDVTQTDGKVVPNVLLAGSGEIVLGSGAKRLAGFTGVEINAAREIIGAGTGLLAADGALNLETTRLSLAARSDQTIVASGALTISQPAILAELWPVSALGGRLSLTGSRVSHGGRIDVPAGTLTLTATGEDTGDSVVLLAGSALNTPGVGTAFADTVAYAPAGKVELVAAQGSVDIQAGAVVNIAAANGGGDAGRLSVTAPNGSFRLGGEIRGSAREGERQGAFTLDVGSLTDSSGTVFSGINDKLNLGGITEERQIRVRQGDITVAADITVTAHRVSLAADSGAITISGRIDASGAEGGRIALFASDDIKLQPGSTLDASASGTDGTGGKVVLGTGSNLAVLAGSTIDVAGGSAGTGGEVLLRAPRTQTGEIETDVAISSLDGTITGARELVVEAFSVYDKIPPGTATFTIDDAVIADIATATLAFFTPENIATISARLGRTADPGFHLRAGVEVRNSGDIVLATDWNLFPLRTSSVQGGQEPGVLSLRAGGNLTLDGSLSDGFDAAGREGILQSGDSWSYRLVGGADLAAANPLAVSPLGVLTSSGDFMLAADKLIRTGTGSIDIAAGRDVNLEAGSGSGGFAATIYTAGTTTVNPSGFDSPISGAYYPTNGGDITITAQGDLRGSTSTQLINDWLLRQGALASDGTFDPALPSPDGTVALQTSWGILFSNFDQNVGALGGGDITLLAGGDVDQFSAVIPTNGRLSGGLNGERPNAANLLVQGGGDLQLRAGGELRGGVYYLGRGQGEIIVDGAVSATDAMGAALPVGTLLALGDADISVQAGGNLVIEAIFNPTITEQPGTGIFVNSSLFFTYSPDSAAQLTSLSGDIVLSNDVQSIDSLTTGLTVESDSQQQAYVIYPGTLRANALQGDILVERRLALYPAAQGTLELLAGGSVTVSPGASINVSDVDPMILPLPASPAAGSAGVFLSNIESLLFDQFFRDPRSHARVPLHQNDAEPIRIVAARGSITGDTANVFGYFSKQARLEAGLDIRDVTLSGQNLRSGDITSLRARRDIIFSTPRNPVSNTLLSNTSSIQIGGPGRVEVLAGRTIDLGNSNGITTRGSLDNPFLPEAGANLLVGAGFGVTDGKLRLPAYQAFITAYLSPTAKRDYLPELRSFMRNLTGNQALSEADALAAFLELSLDEQIPFINQIFYQELRETGRAATADGSDFERGLLAIKTLFPENDYAGDLRLFFSQLRTERGGDLDILTPGGLVNAGLASPPGDLTKPASQLGIVTVRGGSVRAFSADDFLVNQSRVFTLAGGDILIWSTLGDIDAGRGSNTVASAPPPLIFTNEDGIVVVDIAGSASGSGIGVLLTQRGIEPGDVDLIAPSGVVDAGDAGIRSAGNLNIAALIVANVANIQVGGASSGVPAVEAGSLSVGLTGVSNLAADATKAAEKAIEEALEAASEAAAQELPSFITVEVIGLG